MNNPYHDLHYLSKLYREDALREASKRHLAAQAKADREQPSRSGRRLGLKWNSLVTLLRAPETPK